MNDKNLNLTEIRRQKGLTQKQLAEKVGCSQKDISRWESGTVLPSFPNIQKLCDALECTVDELTNNTFKISYECTELINELKADIAEFGPDKIFLAYVRNVCGKAVYTNYDFYNPDDFDEVVNTRRPGEALVMIQASLLLEKLEEQNSIL